jgi:hypothetical protein
MNASAVLGCGLGRRLPTRASAARPFHRAASGEGVVARPS